jgi:hypothetical protein
MIEISGCASCGDCGGISPASPDAEARRTASENPYTAAVVRPLRGNVIASRLTKFFPIIIFPRPWCGHGDDLTDRVCACPRAIAVAIEGLLLTQRPARQRKGPYRRHRASARSRGAARSGDPSGVRSGCAHRRENDEIMPPVMRPSCRCMTPSRVCHYDHKTTRSRSARS